MLRIDSPWGIHVLAMDEALTYYSPSPNTPQLPAFVAEVATSAE
jgi:hypothetical protein